MDYRPASSVIDSYRKRRRQMGPMIAGILAVVLAVVGLVLLFVWLLGPNGPDIKLFATDTPTPTVTFTPTNTLQPSETPTITPTPTETATATPGAPFAYTVQDGDYLAKIVETYQLGDNGIPLLLMLNPQIDPATQIIFPGQTILIPNPGLQLFTPTPLPTGLPRGTKIRYIVIYGDTLAGIASELNSTVDAIVTENTLTDANAIYVGQLLIVPVNLVTPTATKPPTITPTLNPALVTPTFTPTPTTAAAACNYTARQDLVDQLLTLINNARTAQGLPAFTASIQLASAAQNHSIDMACNNYLSHTSLDGRTLEQRIGSQSVTFSAAAENLYAAPLQYGQGDPDDAFNWWMSDPTHRDNILSAQYTQVGIGYAFTATSQLGGYYTVVFVKP